MSKMDFCDTYVQLPFKTDMPTVKNKITYPCVHTNMATLVYSRAPMGLLGMDVWQDQGC